MGVSILTYAQSRVTKPDDIIKDIEYNNYHNNEVYKECTYSIDTTKNDLLLNRNEKRVKNSHNIKKKTCKETLNDNFFWKKIYRSPILNRTKNESSIELGEPESHKSNENFDDKKEEGTRRDSEIANQIQDVTQMTGMHTKDKNIIPRKRTFFAALVPTLLCPCCRGGDDEIDNIDSPQRSMDLYESIELKTNNSDNLSMVKLDASLMSIMHFKNKLNKKKPPVKCYIRALNIFVRNFWRHHFH